MAPEFSRQFVEVGAHTVPPLQANHAQGFAIVGGFRQLFGRGAQNREHFFE